MHPFEHLANSGRRTADFAASPTYEPEDMVQYLRQAAVAQSVGANAPECDTPELDALLNRLFSTADELARAEARLSSFADRLGGPVPECDQKDCDPRGASGLVSRMDALNHDLATTLIDINTTISRLERLA